MRRREFITLLGSATVAWPLAAHAQQTGKLPTIGFLGADASAWSPWTAAFVERLHALGWIEGSEPPLSGIPASEPICIQILQFDTSRA
jgi:putative tryptophan/tyrosine transport system substrate-binding protein